MLLTTREIKRAKGRFGLLTAGAGLLVFVLLFQQLLLGAVLDGLTGAVANQSGEVLVFAKEARRNFAGSLVTPNQLESIMKVPGVADAAELGVTMLAMTAGNATVDASVIGFRIGRAGSPTNIVSGRMPSGANEVVASSEDANGRYTIGSTVTVEPGGTKLTVVGLTEKSRYNVAPTLFIPWVGYTALVKVANPDSPLLLPSAIAVRPAAGASAASLSRDISAAVADIEAVPREIAATDAPGIGAVRVAFSVVMGLGYLVVGVVIGFFFLTLTLQKEPSITLLRAVGAPPGYLVRNLFQQVFCVTAGGLVFGVVLLLAVLAFVRAGVPVDPDPKVIVACAGAAMGVAIVGALAPLRRILRTDPFAVVGRPSLGGLG